MLRIKRLTPTSTIPSYGSAGAAGMDLSADLLDADGQGRKNVDTTGEATLTIRPGQRALVFTGLSAALPSGVYARIAPRSGLAVRKGIDVLAGVVDEDYRGEIGIVLHNTGEEDFVVHQGDRVAQMILEKYQREDIVEVDDLDESDRGAGGFGSTGT